MHFSQVLLDAGHTADFLGLKPRSLPKGYDPVGLGEEGIDPLFLLLLVTLICI